MLKIIFLTTLFLQLTTASEGRLPASYHWGSGGSGGVCSSCGRSYDCGKGSCCRTSNNQLVDPSHTYFGDMLFGGPISSDTGMCIPGGASLHEVCSGGCACNRGLVCYRPMSGICCPASTCRTKAYVDEQNKYWRNCHKNPRCFLPQ